jgi:hypothetical protein
MKTLTIESKTYGTHHILLDDDDYDRVVAEGKWSIHKASGREVFYVRRHAPTDENGKQKTIPLHRFIMDAPKGKVVDHINGDGRDNRKENLRICTRAENRRNCNQPPLGKVAYYGVNIIPKQVKRYQAHIKFNNKVLSRTAYYTAEEAAMEYDKLAKEYHGEFATLNFPDGVPPDVMQKIIEGQKEYEKIRKYRPVEKQSKQKGVSWSRVKKKWRVGLRNKHIGYFKTEEEAIEARLEAEAKYQ